MAEPSKPKTFEDGLYAMQPMWWTIRGDALMAALRQVADGESPDIVYAELYANSDHEAIE